MVFLYCSIDEGGSPWAGQPLITNESFVRMRNEKWWCGAKIMKRRRILIALRAVVIESVAEGLSCTAVTITLALAGKRRLDASYFCFLTPIIYRSAREISRFARNDDTGV